LALSTNGVAGDEDELAPPALELVPAAGEVVLPAPAAFAEVLAPDELPQPAASSVAAAATAVSWTARRHAGRTVTRRVAPAEPSRPC
jgi:hypothetical protein